MQKELCCKDCFYFNRFGFCTIRPDMVVKHKKDDPLCFGFRFKSDYPIEELGSLEEMLSKSIEDCLNKEPMIPRKKTLEERIGELEQKVQKLEKQINELTARLKPHICKGGITMNVIKYGDPQKIEEHNRRRALRVFTCPICGCVWEASIAPGTTEARPGSHLSAMDGYDGWYSDCPMTNCPGVGTELKE